MRNWLCPDLGPTQRLPILNCKPIQLAQLAQLGVVWCCDLLVFTGTELETATMLQVDLMSPINIS